MSLHFHQLVISCKKKKIRGKSVILPQLEPQASTIKVCDKINIQWARPTAKTDFPTLAFDEDLTKCLGGQMDSFYFEEDSKKLSLHNITDINNSDLEGLDPSLELSFDLNSLIEASQTNVNVTTPQLFPEGVLLPETSLDLSGAEAFATTSTSQMPIVEVCT